jgi:uncharacterized protein YjeT (DUF2065 family)
MVAPAIADLADPSPAPVRVADSVHLKPGPIAPRNARRLVAQVCQRADVAGRIVDDAVMIAGELVNISLHQVFSDLLVRVQATDRRVVIAVRDGGYSYPFSVRDGDGVTLRRSTAVVHRLAQSWGCSRGAVSREIWALVREPRTIP